MDVVGVTQAIPNPGQTVEGDNFFFCPGGKGANQAVAAARLGARVKLVGRVGSDLFGPILTEGLEKEGIDTSRIEVDPWHNSGIAIILLDSKKENRIVVIPGANIHTSNSKLQSAESDIKDSDYLMLQCEIDPNASLASANAARQSGVKVVLDPAPAMNITKELIASSDVLTPNQTEAKSITGIDVVDVQSARDACHALLKFGIDAVVITIGSMGAYYASSGGDQGHIQAHQVEVVDTVAAGDAFNGSLTVSLARGASLRDAVRRAVAAGSLTVTKTGAQESMPYLKDVDELIHK